jgi:nucleoid-associated protein YgaU
MTEIALQAPKPKPPVEQGAPSDWAQPQHAFLEKFEAKPAKNGSPTVGGSKGKIAFQFNPKEVSITKSAKWERKPAKGKKAGYTEFSGAEPCKMTLELFFDATTNGAVDVVQSVDDLFACCVPPDGGKQGEKSVPNLVVFHWGAVTSFAAFVSQVSAKYTRFSADGVPIRAVCTVNLEEIDVTIPKQNPTSGTPNADTLHTMVAGDTLALVAYQEYGDPLLWRALADYNGIDDPMRIAHGTRVLLPRLDRLSASA